ncbi:GDSL esterase/lipase [Panicum miliaceum]|uniref:GDSL esterase/lipase n=1 Tax=Panicum miliaceum TaxID=4540 RepID=A0A3L6QZL2_PANMI|nr:GDSL esterase/lipase [Panicum miliaceum]
MYSSAEALGLPLLPPSLAKNQRFEQGANFAVTGATAPEQHRALYKQVGGVRLPQSNISLSDELGWFDAMKPSLCGSPQDKLTA